MCLYSKTSKCLTAEEPITVYKYVAKRYEIIGGLYTGRRMSADGLRSLCAPLQTEVRWVSPYTGKMAYTVGETAYDHMFRCTVDERVTFTNLSGEVSYKIERGLHAFTDLDSAMVRARMFTGVDCETGVLRCTIPAGAKYWMGDEQDHDICADTLVVEELVAEFFEGV